jgi:hypothetical protein
MVGMVLTLLIAAPLTEYRYVAAGHVGLPFLLMALWAGAHDEEDDADARR